MTFPAALDSTAYTKLRGTGAVAPTYSADQYLCLGSNTIVCQATIATVPSTDSFASVTVNTPSMGAVASIEAGMTVLIGTSTTLRAAYFTGRARLNGSGSTVSLNETSAPIQVGDVLTVLRDYRLFGKLGRESSGSYFKDYSLTFTPPGPLIYNLQSAYAGVVSGTPTGYTVSFAPLALAVTSGATISAWAWTIPSGGTITVGSASTQNITVRFDAAAAEYWIKLIVTDSGGRTSTRRFPVWAIPANLSTTVALGFEGAQIERDIDGGHLANVKAFTGVDTLLDNTLACILSVERYNGTETFVVSNIEFVGRLRTGQYSTRADFTYSVLQEGAYDIEGIGAQLARVSAPSIYMRSKTSPVVWDEIKDLTLWRAMWYLLFHSTFHELHSLSFDETGTTYRYPAIQTQGGNLFDAITDLAQSITAGMEFASSGACKIARHASYQTTAERNALTTVANFTDADWLDFNLTHEEVETIGAVGGDGGSFNTTSGKVLALLGNAPKVAQGNADGTSNLPRQILTANLTKAGAISELAARLGHHYAFANPVDLLNVTFPDGYHWLIPSNSQWYTFTIAASENTGGRVFTTAERWQCQNVSYGHNHETGGREVYATFRRESVGTPGKAYEPPASNESTINIPPIPPLPPFPPINTPPDIYLPANPDPEDVPPPLVLNVPTNGNAVVEGTATGLWSSLNWLLTNNPDRIEVTPSGLNGTVRGFAFGFGREAYLLESDGTNSWVWYTEDVLAAAPVWTESGIMVGVFSVIRPTSTPGAVYIYGIGVNSCTDTVEISGTYTPPASLSYDSGTGQYTATCTTPNAASSDFVIELQFPTGCCTFNYVSESGWSNTIGNFTLSVTDCSDVLAESFSVPPSNMNGQAFKRVYFRSNTAFSVVFTLTGTGAGAQTRYSTNYGASFSPARSVGTSLSLFGGMDTIRIGVPVLAGASGQTKIATSAGGAYSSYGNAMPAGAHPQAIHLNRLQFSSSTPNVSTNTPQYLVASGTLSSNQALWKVISGTLTDITPDFGGNFFKAVSPNCITMPWWSGSKMAVIGDFNGTRRLKLSTTAGVSWSNGGSALSSNATYIRYRKGDRQMRQLFIADTVPVFSPDHGGTLYAKTHPSPLGSIVDPLILIEAYG